jgi:hypothetical protein
MPDEIEDTLVRLVEQEAKGFHVRDSASANWVIRKIVECRRYKERVEEWAAMEIKRAEREESFFLARFGLQLETWARQQVAAQHNRKSIKLPAGTLGFRTEPTRLSVTNEPALLAWCKANLPGAIQIIERVLKNSVKDHINTTGEIPNGTEVAGGQQKFYIK